MKRRHPTEANYDASDEEHAAPAALTRTEYDLLWTLIDRKGPTGATNDTPLTCTDAVRLGGLTGRGVLSALVKKGYLHDYGPRHGYVPTIWLHVEPGRVHWRSLSANQRAILAVFIREMCCTRNSTEISIDKHDRAQQQRRSIQPTGVSVPYEGNPNDRRDIARLVKLGCLLHLKPRRGYRANPSGWPTDAPGRPWCPIIDFAEGVLRRRAKLEYQRRLFGDRTGRT